MAGLPSGNVTLSFTGRLLKDLVVKPVVEQFGQSGVTAAATQVGGGKIGGGSGSVLSGFQKSGNMDFGLADVIAQINLKVGFRTQASWRVANWQARRYNNHFALLTPSEKTELKREGLVRHRKHAASMALSRPLPLPKASPVSSFRSICKLMPESETTGEEAINVNQGLLLVGVLLLIFFAGIAHEAPSWERHSGLLIVFGGAACAPFLAIAYRLLGD